MRSDEGPLRVDIGPDNPTGAGSAPVVHHPDAFPVTIDPAVKGHAPGPPSAAERLDARLTAVEAALGELTARFTGENERALARERVIDRQHDEIERLKGIERAGRLRPVVTDLCRLRGDLLRQAETVPTDLTGPQVAALLRSFAASVEEALERCGVAVLHRGIGAAFVPGQQQVTSIVETDDPDQDGTVANVVQDGYAETDGGKIVAPARITLHRYTSKEKKTDD